MPSRSCRRVSVRLLLLGAAMGAGAAVSAPSQPADVATLARSVMMDTGVPSVSVAIVQNDRVEYCNAFGRATRSGQPARPSMRYCVGSVSKQFTAAALLMLAEHKRLSLSDPVEAYVPGLTRGRYVTLREVLSHTSGYRDFWPQDYVPDFLQHATTPRQIADQWAGRALDFEPRTHWQYSNTNYVVAGLAVEKAGGEALYPFLQEHVFTPLGMHSVVNVDGHPLSQGDAEPFTRAALGPLRPAPPVAAGWQYGAIELGMTARDLAVWDISVLRQSLMTSDSYRLLERPVALSNGQSTHYGLGLWVEGSGAQRVLEHGGETSGFSAENRVYPAQHAAIVVLVNQDQTDAARILSDRLAIRLGLASAPPPSSTRDSQASRHVETTRRMLQALQRGQLDVRQLTADAQAYFTPQARSDYQTSLAALGSIGAIAADSPVYRGGFVYRGYETTLGHKAVDVSTLETPDGHLEQFLVIPEP